MMTDENLKQLGLRQENPELGTLRTLGHALEARLRHPEPDYKSIALIAGQIQRKAKKLRDQEANREKEKEAYLKAIRSID